MPEDALSRRLPLYAYLEPLVAGRRILEIGAARDASPGFLGSLGAAQVAVVEGDLAGVRDLFDVVLVPEADALLRQPGAVAGWRRLLAEKGRLVVAVANPERGGEPGGVGYYELHDAVGPFFPRVQMLGVTPFLGVGLVEFAGTVDGLRIDARLVKDGPELPALYVAVAGSEPVMGLGYALVQLPWTAAASRAEGAGRASPASREMARTGELGAKLVEAIAQAESATRVARAQRDEIEELRGRLGRAAEDRATSDAEMARLRRGLADADEAVMTLTRRTAEEMSVVAEHLTAGLRAPIAAEARSASAELFAARDEIDLLRLKLAESDARAAAAEQRLEEIGGSVRERQGALEDALERLRLADSELARARRAAARFEEEARAASAGARGVEERDRALAGRDERIARLEADKQDLVWRLAELEEKLRTAIARALRIEGARGPTDARLPAGAGPSEDDSAASRNRGLEGFHRAATAHVGELTEIRASLGEQAALVAELEDALGVAEARASSASAEAAALRKTAKDLEEADRTRRTRLAELEGKLLRFEHERKSAPSGDGANEERDRRLGELETERDLLRRRADDERAAWLRERDELRAALVRGAQAETGRNGHDAGGAKPSAPGDQVSADDAAGRLETTLGNYRQRADRLRDDLEGIRRRLDALSSAEIAGFLEELGEDLAELGR